MPDTSIPILLDTDIGSDVDDSLALAYLLKQPRCDLLGVTTVSGEPELRASLVDAVCRQVGREDIAIHVGTEKPLMIAPLQPKAQHAVVLGLSFPPLSTRERGNPSPVRDTPFHHRRFDTASTAIDFLRDTIRARPGEITLLAIGPLTNIALLFAVDPQIPKLIDRLVLMGGQHISWAHTGKAIAEWNIRCDPHAAAMVFGSEAKIAAVGYEITTQCRLAAEDCRKRFQEPNIPSILLPMAEQWLQHQAEVTFHDPLAAALIFEPDLCSMASGGIDVETVSERASGMTYWTPDSRGRHEVASSVDRDSFFEHYFDILTS